MGWVGSVNSWVGLGLKIGLTAMSGSNYSTRSRVFVRNIHVTFELNDLWWPCSIFTCSLMVLYGFILVMFKGQGRRSRSRSHEEKYCYSGRLDPNWGLSSWFLNTICYIGVLDKNAALISVHNNIEWNDLRGAECKMLKNTFISWFGESPVTLRQY